MIWFFNRLVRERIFPLAGYFGRLMSFSASVFTQAVDVCVLAARQGVVLSSQWMVWSCGWLVRGRFIQQMGVLGAECP